MSKLDNISKKFILSNILCEIVKTWTKGLVKGKMGNKINYKNFKNDEENIMKYNHGQIVYFRYGFSGVRGEVEKGFEHVLEYGLPAYREALKQGIGHNLASIEALVNIMAYLNDTNILYRSNLKTLKNIQGRCQDIIAAGGVATESGWAKYRVLNDFIVKKGVSPGGAADLLAITLYFYKLDESIEDIFFNY
jgi:triphosphoribosyl-dephospho-CoA synthetase